MISCWRYRSCHPTSHYQGSTLAGSLPYIRILEASTEKETMLGPTKTSISEDRFKSFDWEDFYKDAQEPIPIDMPSPRVKSMSTHCFVDANHAGDTTTRRSMTGILIFCNRAQIIWHSKRKNGVETSTFGSELTALKNAVNSDPRLTFRPRFSACCAI